MQIAVRYAGVPLPLLPFTLCAAPHGVRSPGGYRPTGFSDPRGMMPQA